MGGNPDCVLIGRCDALVLIDSVKTDGSELTGFTLTGMTYTDAVMVELSGETIIKNNVFYNNSGTHYNDDHTIRVDRTSATITDNLFYGNLGWGGEISVSGLGTSVDIVHNTLVRNRLGIRVWSADPGSVVIRNNIITHCAGWGLRTSTTNSDNNILWANHPNYADGTTPGENDIIANPMICATTGENAFHPSTESPAAPGNNVSGELIGAYPADAVCDYCCESDARGNASGDTEDNVNITDVVFLVTYLFGVPPGPAPDCVQEANVNGDINGDTELVNISDVTYLINYLYGIPLGPAPAACP